MFPSPYAVLGDGADGNCGDGDAVTPPVMKMVNNCDNVIVFIGSLVKSEL